MLLGEVTVRLDVVEADPEDLCIEFAKCEYVVPKGAGLGRTPRRIVLGVEVKHDPLVPVIFERVQLALLVRQFEFRRRFSNAGSGEYCRNRESGESNGNTIHEACLVETGISL